VLEFRDHAAAVPKRHVVSINETSGVFFRDLVARAFQIDRPEDAPLCIDNIGSI
jgi:hypothetical protein